MLLIYRRCTKVGNSDHWPCSCMEELEKSVSRWIDCGKGWEYHLVIKLKKQLLFICWPCNNYYIIIKIEHM